MTTTTAAQACCTECLSTSSVLELVPGLTDRRLKYWTDNGLVRTSGHLHDPKFRRVADADTQRRAGRLPGFLRSEVDVLRIVIGLPAMAPAIAFELARAGVVSAPGVELSIRVRPCFEACLGCQSTDDPWAVCRLLSGHTGGHLYECEHRAVA